MRTYSIITPPQQVKNYVEAKFPADKFTYKYYWYKGTKSRIYAVMVLLNSEAYDNSIQMPLKDFVL